jgi:hypothetical protein
MVVVVVGALTMVVVVVVGGRKGFPQEVLGSHVTASDLERLMSESNRSDIRIRNQAPPPIPLSVLRVLRARLELDF